MDGRKSLYTAWLVFLGIFILAGLVAAFRLFSEGHWLFNTNDVIIWSLPLGVYIFLALTSSGLILLASLPLVFGIRQFEPFAKRQVFLAIASLGGAFAAIALEVGSLWHMIYILLSPNLTSPIWWMGAIYSVEMVLLAAKFWRMQQGDWHSGLSRALGTASFFCALIAPLMIGSIFGMTESRATYFGPIMSIYCLLMALLSGTALFILYSMILRRFSSRPADMGQNEVYNAFGALLTYVAGTVVLFTLVKTAIEWATVVPEFLEIRNFGHVFGTFLGFPTEVALGLIVPFLLLLIPAVRRSTGGKTAAAALILAGTLAMHMQILIAGQSHPIGPKAEQFKGMLTYAPSVWEWIVFLFALAVMLLVNTLGERYLRLEAVPEA